MKISAKMAGSFTALMAFSAPTLAHVGQDGQTGFASGFLHPLTGYDHLTALILIGIFAGVYSAKHAWKIVACFSFALLGGFAVGVEWANAHQAESLVTLSLLVLPVAILAYRKTGIIKLLSLAAIVAFSACHGLVQGAEAIGSVAEFGLGSLLSSLMVIAVVMLVSKWVQSVIKELNIARVK